SIVSQSVLFELQPKSKNLRACFQLRAPLPLLPFFVWRKQMDTRPKSFPSRKGPHEGDRKVRHGAVDD
ncbi:unnamed protein product, partial [Amoebophrya sp. A120]